MCDVIELDPLKHSSVNDSKKKKKSKSRSKSEGSKPFSGFLTSFRKKKDKEASRRPDELLQAQLNPTFSFSFRNDKANVGKPSYNNNPHAIEARNSNLNVGRSTLSRGGNAVGDRPSLATTNTTSGKSLRDMWSSFTMRRQQGSSPTPTACGMQRVAESPSPSTRQQGEEHPLQQQERQSSLYSHLPASSILSSMEHVENQWKSLRSLMQEQVQQAVNSMTGYEEEAPPKEPNSHLIHKKVKSLDWEDLTGLGDGAEVGDTFVMDGVDLDEQRRMLDSFSNVHKKMASNHTSTTHPTHLGSSCPETSSLWDISANSLDVSHVDVDEQRRILESVSRNSSVCSSASRSSPRETRKKAPPATPTAAGSREKQLIEVAPGVTLPLIGAVETCHAIMDGRTRKTKCCCCDNELTCTIDAAVVLCSDCWVCSPVAEYHQEHQYDWIAALMRNGQEDNTFLGIGFKDDDIQNQMKRSIQK